LEVDTIHHLLTALCSTACSEIAVSKLHPAPELYYILSSHSEFLLSREEHRLKVLENRMLRKILIC